MTHQEIGKTELPIELTVQERDQHNNLTGGWYYASDSEIIEAARNLPSAREVVVRQNALGESVIHMAGNPLADAAVNLRSGHHVVILIADARRTEEE